MNQRYIFFMIVLCGAWITSCDKDDAQVFSESADERMTEQLEIYDAALQEADYGWKVIYFPDTTEDLGGWTFVMKFSEGSVVEMIGDVSSEPEIESGTYTLANTQGPVLNFASYLPITELADPTSDYPDARFGSNEFVLVSLADNGNYITLKSKRNEMPFIMYKADEDDWEDVTLHDNIEAALAGTLEEAPSVYRYLTIGDGTDSVSYDVDEYEDYIRYITFYDATDVSVEMGCGVAYAQDTLYLKPAVEYGDVTFSKLVYDDEDALFTYTTDGVTAKIHYSMECLNISDDYLDISNDIYNKFSYREDYLEDTKYTSDNYIALYQEADAAFYDYSERDLYRIEMTFEPDDGTGWVRYRYTKASSSSTYSIYHYFHYEVVDQKIFLTNNTDEESTGWSSSSTTLLSALEDLDAFYFNSSGLYIDEVPETFTYSNTVYTFTSAEDPTVRVPTYAALD